MKLALLILILALVWVAITNGFTLPNLLLGIAIAMAATFLLRADYGRPRLLNKAGRFAALFLLFGRELVLSAVRVSILVLTPGVARRLRPALVSVPLTITRDSEITLLACLITLTPGTLSVDVSEDHKSLLVHVLDLKDRDALLADVANGFEKRIRELSA